jgi:hypothetical protein
MPISGSFDLTSRAWALVQDRQQNQVAVAILKQQEASEREVAAMVDEAVKAAPAPGTGLKVDKSV